MNPIKKNKFTIIFNHNGYEELAEYIEDNNFKKILILTDDNTKENCLDIFISSLSATNNQVSNLVNSRFFYHSVKPGENSKNIETSIEVWKFLIDKGFTIENIAMISGSYIAVSLILLLIFRKKLEPFKL